MNIMTVIVGPMGVGFGWSDPSWFVRGWRGWAFSWGRVFAGWHLTVLGFDFSLWFKR